MAPKPAITDLLNPLTALRHLYRSRDLLQQLIKREIQVRYRGSMFGLFWVFATPLFMLAVYTFVFSVVFKARWGTQPDQSKVNFALTMFCGLAVFNIFGESLNAATKTITGNPNYVKRVVFPLEVLPVAAMLSALFFGLIWMAILVIGVVAFMHPPGITIICVPLVILPLLLFTCGFSWLLASLAVYFRDLVHAVSILLHMLFFMTPIFYSIEMVPPAFQRWLRINPMADIVENTRAILIFGHWPNWAALGLLTVGSLVVFQLGYAWFMKTKGGFADVL